jgi:hypothetical protein
MGVFICRHVLNHERPVGLIVHHADGRWQLTCGQYDHSVPELHSVHLEHLVAKQSELADLVSNLPAGFLAEQVGGRWGQCAHDD